ncbi:hypothetical protein [Motiliproteus sp. SC1-56]|uniref:hypothetical protein n=1 Tax=Motiliproteus sp. SC1-56 TaxID=2799565 RepID=UPI001A8F383B|nr:hypothetical protein [Motiliproteus sp. SC1-56]
MVYPVASGPQRALSSTRKEGEVQSREARADTAGGSVQTCLSLTDLGMLTRLDDLGPRPRLADCLERLGWKEPPLSGDYPNLRVTRVYLGNEFCERLLPTPAALRSAYAALRALDAGITLVTPLLTDSGLKRLRPLLSILEEGCEVVVNDWGGLRLLRTAYPGLRPVLGRQLYKMIKDPRMPSAQWSRLHPHGGRSAPFQQLLKGFDVAQIEMDLPPFIGPEQFQVGAFALSVHLPYAYVVKGRMCRIGSLNQPDQGKFVAGHGCEKECLSYVTRLARPRSGEPGLVEFQRGNTQFYRYSAAMEAPLREALEQGQVQRLVFAGDWNEHRCPAQ